MDVISALIAPDVMGMDDAQPDGNERAADYEHETRKAIYAKWLQGDLTYDEMIFEIQTVGKY
jgi:hypothetical protein